jgi:hypothetical protein
MLVYMPVVMFPSEIAISEPLLPRHRNDLTPRVQEHTTFETAHHEMVMARCFAIYQETGVLRTAMKAAAWTSGSTVSTDAGRKEANHCHATARLIAWLHYRLSSGYSDVVSVDEVLPTMLRLLVTSRQSEFYEFVRAAPWADTSLNLSTVDGFRRTLLEAVRPPQWTERRHWK